MIDDLRFGEDGLVTGVVQDATTRRVLMVAHLDRTAVERTLTTGEAHFWSRSRQRLWHKGETSGNTMAVRSIRPDCDGDVLLIEVDPAGPACHRDTTTCFDDGIDREEGFAWLETLWSTIGSRARERPEGSYTTSLIDGGVAATGAKVIEEAGELVEAAGHHAEGKADDHRVAEEAADLAYHAFVLLAERGIAPRDVVEVLRERTR